MPTSESKRRWFRLSPDRFVVSLLLVVGLLWLSERFQWFGFNHHKGWTVLIAVAAVGVAALVMLLWWVASLAFRWRFQFGIRSVLAFCLACSIAVSWLAVERERARRQAEVVEGSNSDKLAIYDWQVDANENQTRGNPAPPGPDWLRNVLGVEFFSEVVVIDFDESNTTDAGLERLSDLPKLRHLDLSNTKVTDGWLEHLKRLPQLKYLRLNHTQVSDAGLQTLTGLSQLQVLGVARTKITDGGLEHVRGLPQLKHLLLGDTEVTDAGLERLKGLTQLQSLDLIRTRVTDAGLEYIEGLVQLRNLSLQGTEVTDAWLEHLKGLHQLEYVGLTATKITDVGLDHLKGLTQLQLLWLDRTQVTDTGVKTLQQALPTCQIIH